MLVLGSVMIRLVVEALELRIMVLIGLALRVLCSPADGTRLRAGLSGLLIPYPALLSAP